MIHLFLLTLIPLVVCGVAANRFKYTISKAEFALIATLGVAAAITSFYLARWGAMSDVEHWNGRVTSKLHEQSGCCHSYPCNCTTTTDAQGFTSTSCQTCYEHATDYQWSLEYSTGDINTILKCEPDKNKVPAFWHQAKIGDAASLPHRYTNYLKADPESLLRHGTPEEYLDLVPDFPRTYNFHRVQKVVSHGVTVPPEWQDGLMEMNADIGADKQVDVVMLFTTIQNPKYAQAVEAKWLYGPKNAVIIVAGVGQEGVVTWARVVTISRVEDLKISLRDGMQGMRLDEPAKAIAFIKREVRQKYTRTPMAEYEYLASAASPTSGMLVLLYLLLLALSVGLVAWAHQKDIFGGSSHGRLRFGNRRFRF